MIKKTVTYTDFDDVERTEEFYFHLTKAELVEMETGVTGGLVKLLEKIIAEKDKKRLVEYVKEFIIKSYGVKSADGRRFIKTQEVKDAFVETEAYSKIFMEMASDDQAFAKFIYGIMPAEMQKSINFPLNNPPAN